MSSTTKTIIAIIAVILVAGLIWYFGFYRKRVPQPTGQPAALSPVAAPASNLGAQLYRRANNPIQDKLPSTVAPVPNPVQNIYKNPFE